MIRVGMLRTAIRNRQVEMEEILKMMKKLIILEEQRKDMREALVYSELV